MGTANGRKSIFITGAASGMGRETARLFHQKGWFVGCYDVNVDGLKSLEAEIGSADCIVGKLDVTNREAFIAWRLLILQPRPMAKWTSSTTMPVLAAAVFADQPFEDVMAVVNTNFVGVLIGIHEAIKYLKATPNSLCFTTSSSSATFGMPSIAVYSATKHAVKGLTEALAVEFKAVGVRVADVLPGLIDTPILPPGVAAAAPKEGMFRSIPPIEVAKMVWEAYNSDKLHWYVPAEIYELDKAAGQQSRAWCASRSFR